MGLDSLSLELWFQRQDELKRSALTEDEVNLLEEGDVIRIHRPASVKPGNDAEDLEGPIEKIERYGTESVLAVTVGGRYFDRASAYFYHTSL
jgi:hypothetical protein